MSSVWFLGASGFLVILLCMSGSIVRLSLGSMSYFSRVSVSRLKERCLCTHACDVFKKTRTDSQNHSEQYLTYGDLRVLSIIDVRTADTVSCRLMDQSRVIYQVLLPLN